MKRRTRLQCPKCKKICVNHVCGSNQHRLGNSVYQLARGNEDDPQCFLRARQCEECGRSWTSAELPLDYVNELLSMRKRLWRVEESAEEVRRKENEEQQKRNEDLKAIKVLLAECVTQNSNQAHLLKEIQCMLPQTTEEWLDSYMAEMTHLGVTF